MGITNEHPRGIYKGEKGDKKEKAGGRTMVHLPALSGLLDSNQRPLRPERSTLPTALNPERYFL